MALIVCPECNKQISDQAGACPHCGYPLKSGEIVRSVKKDAVEYERNRKKILTVIGVICVALGLALLLTCLLLIKRNNDAAEAARQESVRQESIRQESIKQSEAEEAARIEAHNQYVLVANTFASSTKIGADEAYYICRLIGNVWHNAIYKVDDPETDPYTKVNGVFVEDFNDALNALYSTEVNSKDVIAAMENRYETEELYKQLMSPPDELKDLSEGIKKLYLVYRKYMALALETEGSLNSFKEDFDKYSKEFNNLYEEMKILIPDYK